jgi:phosphomethylpyrimidine synthase
MSARTGRDWVDNQQDCPEGRTVREIRVRQDVRKYATEQGLAESDALETGLQAKAKEFEKGAEVYSALWWRLSQPQDRQSARLLQQAHWRAATD